jgi:hypothetical protein
MSTANTTGLQVGATGVLSGVRYTVRGRVVLSMVADDGEKYYWNEFDVVDDSGATATLVHEEEENGPVWKLFTLLEPRRPLTVAEAAAKRVGDTIEFEGRRIPVTLVDESRVERIDGQAPEGVAIGDVARYFNADAGSGRMYVASWTGDEIEFYLGGPLGRGQVERAFKLAPPSSGARAYAGGGSSNWSGGGFTWDASTLRMLLVLFGVGAYVLLQLGSCHRRGGTTAAAPAMRPAPTEVLPTAASGQLGSTRYTIASQTTTDVLSPGQRFRAREYWLRTPEGDEVLLVNGWGGDAGGWLLLRSVEVALTPPQAGALRAGEKVRLAEREFPLVQLHLVRWSKIDGEIAGSPWLPSEQYGFLARAGEDWLLCRWSESGLRAWVGQRLTQATVTEAFRAR